RTLTVPFRKTPVQLSELGIDNIKNCVIEDTSVMTYENGALQPLQEGSTQMDVVFADTTIQTDIANVVTVDQQPTAQEASASVEAPKDDNEDKTYGIKKFIIAGGAALLILLVMVEYLLIMKPGKKKKKKAPAPASEPVEEEDNREMLESLQAAFKKKKGISDTDDK
ncbi:MAG: hypothetical protein IJ129_00580, partial [Ruminococcus sp.]|nr:hypothetical protein [Ruminococcus sp.]